MYPLHLCCIYSSSKAHNPNLSMRKRIRQTQIEDTLQNAWPGLKKKFQGRENQESTEKLMLTRGAQGDLMTKCIVVSRIGFWNKKIDISEKNWWNLYKVSSLVSSSVLVLIS